MSRIWIAALLPLVLWLVVSRISAGMSGWRTLARRFAATAPIRGERLRFGSGAMGRLPLPIRYSRCLSIVVGPAGLGLSLMLLFRFGAKPLFIPWPEIESVEEVRYLFVRVLALRVRGEWPTLFFRGRPEKLIRQAWAAAGRAGAGPAESARRIEAGPD